MKLVYFLILLILSNFVGNKNFYPINSKLNTQNQTSIPIGAQVDTSFSDEFNKSKSYDYIKQQLNFGYRIPGSNESRNCLKAIKEEMSILNSTHIINFSISGVNCQHLIAKLESNSSNIVIFAAHYDSRAVAEKDNNESLQNLPIQGANDGASGVAVMMEMARVLATAQMKWNTDFWFLFIDAEDQGSSNGLSGIEGWNWCEGSEWLAEDMETNPSSYFKPDQSINSIQAFILLDMVGGTNLKFIKESHSSTDLLKNVFQVGNSLGYTSEFNLDGSRYSIIDDHVPFAKKGIPTVDLIIKFWDLDNGWPYHHTHQDNIENISPESLDLTGKTLLQFVYQNYYSKSNKEAPQFSSNSSLEILIYSLITGSLVIIVGISIYSKKKSMKRTND
ncbi:M28 family peptidase [Candidatus Lokiarchaeum ossiferum]|uniref:M28 family peptidase n=1 Tax=Candidatus Lokiarchaeum ossiferum TaxID=2951803 RepID=UPI00352FAD57